MRVVRRTFALLALSAGLSGCATLLSPRSGLDALPRTRLALVSGPASHDASDSLECAGGAAASDATSSRAVVVGRNQSFEPRWRIQPQRVVRVRIENATDLPHWNAENRAEVVRALNAWQLAGAPVTFLVVEGDTAADVVVHWIDRFDSRFEGWTTVSWNHEGWLVSGDVQLALRSPAGQLLGPSEREQVVMHELGHILGLSHSGSSSSIMSPVVRVTAIAELDVAALRSLYQEGESPTESRSLTLHGVAAGDRCAGRAGPVTR